MFRSAFSRRFRPMWIGVSLIALFAVAFSFPPVRAWAGDLLDLFRVKQIAVVPVDATRLNQIGTDSALGKQIAQMLSDSVTVTKEAGKPQVVKNAADASRLTGFAVRLPTSRTDSPQITVSGEAAFQFLVNRARAQTLLNEAGASNLQLPASLDGALIKVDIPAGVTAGYGNCPSPTAEPTPASGEVGPDRLAGRRFQDCVLLVEIPSPTVVTPPDVNLEQLAEIGLQFTGMTAEQARAFSQTVDWTSTLVIPIPRNGSSYEKVSVDGTTGYLIQRPAGDAPQYALVWVKNDIIYAIGALGSDTGTALAMANSLH